MSSQRNSDLWTTDPPRPHDVLFGRGSGPNDHEGNIRFRDIVNERKEEYMSTNHRQTKARIAKEVVDAVFARNGRFLRKADTKDMKRLRIPKDTDAYCLVEENSIIEKAKQALRQNREKDAPSRVPVKGSVPVVGKVTPSLESSPGSDNLRETSKPAASTVPVPVLSDSSLTPLDPETAPVVFPGEVAYPQYGSSSDGTWVGSSMMRSGDLDLEYAPDATALTQAAAVLGGLSEGTSPSSQLPTRHNSYDPSSPMPVVSSMPPPPQGEPDVEHRRSLKVSDLMQHFNQMKTEGGNQFNESGDMSMGTFGASTDTLDAGGPTDVMEPYPLDGRNSNSLSSSAAAFFKTALEDSSSDLSMLRRETSTGSSAGYGSGTQFSPSPNASQDSRRGLLTSRPKPIAARLGSSDASLTIDHIAAMWSSNRNQVSQVLEGNEEDASSRELSPRKVNAMADDPDNMSSLGHDSMDIVKAMGMGSSGSVALDNNSGSAASGSGASNMDFSAMKSGGMGSSSGTDSGIVSGGSGQMQL